MNEFGFRRAIERRARRLRSARSARTRIWSGLGLAGALGWVVALPIVGGAFLGHWLDVRFGTGLQLTLGLLVLGIAVGAYSVWRFFLREEP